MKKVTIKRAPCSVCGSEKSEGYPEPVEIIWLCKGHRADLHFVERRLTVSDVEYILEEYDKK